MEQRAPMQRHTSHLKVEEHARMIGRVVREFNKVKICYKMSIISIIIRKFVAYNNNS